MTRASKELGGDWSRIESLDASHFGGRDAAVACAAILHGAHAGAFSWRLSSQNLNPGDDCGALAFAARERFLIDTSLKSNDYPNVLIVDGGKAQLNAIKDFVPPSIRLLALVKGDRGSVEQRRNGEKLLCGRSGKLLARGDSIPRLVRLARDEAHSAALSTHRKLRQARLVSDDNSNDEDINFLKISKKKSPKSSKSLPLDTFELERLRRLLDRLAFGNVKEYVQPKVSSLLLKETAKNDAVVRAEIQSLRQEFIKNGASLQKETLSGTAYKLETPWQHATEPQRQAVDAILDRLDDPESAGIACLRGVTGCGKTFCMATIIANRGVPALVVAPNKVLAAQLYDELRKMFPTNLVSFFISYYDFYRPEFVNANKGAYKSKRSKINQDLDRLRHQATAALASGRQDVIIVASVSCIYGLGVPEHYYTHSICVGDDLLEVSDVLTHRLGFRQDDEQKSNISQVYPGRGQFRLSSDELLVTPADDSHILVYKIKFDEEQRVDSTYCVLRNNDSTDIQLLDNEIKLLPANHYATASSTEARERLCRDIERELGIRISELNKQGKYDAAERLTDRTHRDIDLIRRTGKCPGIENYSRHLVGSAPGEPPITLLDYFPVRHNTSRFIVILDESHLTLPQLGSCSAADRSRKAELVKNGYRLPSALDNRPLTYQEFWERIPAAVLVSATPGKHEAQLLQRCLSSRCQDIAADLVIRPTNIPDPNVLLRGTENQLHDAIKEAKRRAQRDECTIIVALSVAEAKAVAEKCAEAGLKSAALTGGLKPSERASILRNLHTGELDVVVGIQLLREGIDLPRCSLVLVLNADKEGFLRTDVALTQVIGRAARHIDGTAILYGDSITPAMQRAIDETNRRRSIQIAYNLRNNFSASPLATKTFSHGTSILDILIK
uniref:Helicase ATP-binding domain-containing protein n=1 Tax=Aureoumbra lagunensis TaxID=44058 RepID=A0A6S7ZQC5_9STRA